MKLREPDDLVVQWSIVQRITDLCLIRRHGPRRDLHGRGQVNHGSTGAPYPMFEVFWIVLAGLALNQLRKFVERVAHHRRGQFRGLLRNSLLEKTERHARAYHSVTQ